MKSLILTIAAFTSILNASEIISNKTFETYAETWISKKLEDKLIQFTVNQKTVVLEKDINLYVNVIFKNGDNFEFKSKFTTLGSKLHVASGTTLKSRGGQSLQIKIVESEKQETCWLIYGEIKSYEVFKSKANQTMIRGNRVISQNTDVNKWIALKLFSVASSLNINTNSGH